MSGAISLLPCTDSENILHKMQWCLVFHSQNIIQVINLRRMRWVGQVAVEVIGGLHTWFWREDLREIDHLEDLRTDGRIIKLIFKKWYGVEWTGFI